MFRGDIMKIEEQDMNVLIDIVKKSFKTEVPTIGYCCQKNIVITWSARKKHEFTFYAFYIKPNNNDYGLSSSSELDIIFEVNREKPDYEDVRRIFILEFNKIGEIE
jgi:hypothetical protein